LIFALWPTTFFFRMAYAESLFVLSSLVVLYGISRRWASLPLAVLAGLASATRPVGIAVSAAFLWHLYWQQGSWGTRLGRLGLWAPVACWGLLAYVGYQHVMFDEPLAFARTQAHWVSRPPVRNPDLTEKLCALATLEPATGVYDPESSRYWGISSTGGNLLFTLAFWNPVLFLLAGGLVAYGAMRKWLTGPEVVLGAMALAIPYLTRAYEMSMASHGRFAAAVIPAYLVAGRLLSSVSPLVAVAVISGSAAGLFCWTSLYAAGYAFY